MSDISETNASVSAGSTSRRVSVQRESAGRCADLDRDRAGQLRRSRTRLEEDEEVRLVELVDPEDHAQRALGVDLPHLGPTGPQQPAPPCLHGSVIDHFVVVVASELGQPLLLGHGVDDVFDLAVLVRTSVGSPGIATFKATR